MKWFLVLTVCVLAGDVDAQRWKFMAKFARKNVVSEKSDNKIETTNEETAGRRLEDLKGSLRGGLESINRNGQQPDGDIAVEGRKLGDVMGGLREGLETNRRNGKAVETETTEEGKRFGNRRGEKKRDREIFNRNEEQVEATQASELEDGRRFGDRRGENERHRDIFEKHRRNEDEVETTQASETTEGGRRFGDRRGEKHREIFDRRNEEEVEATQASETTEGGRRFGDRRGEKEKHREIFDRRNEEEVEATQASETTEAGRRFGDRREEKERKIGLELKRNNGKAEELTQDVEPTEEGRRIGGRREEKERKGTNEDVDQPTDSGRKKSIFDLFSSRITGGAKEEESTVEESGSSISYSWERTAGGVQFEERAEIWNESGVVDLDTKGIDAQSATRDASVRYAYADNLETGNMTIKIDSTCFVSGVGIPLEFISEEIISRDSAGELGRPAGTLTMEATERVCQLDTLDETVKTFCEGSDIFETVISLYNDEIDSGLTKVPTVFMVVSLKFPDESVDLCPGEAPTRRPPGGGMFARFSKWG